MYSYSVKFTNPNNIRIHIRYGKHYSLTSGHDCHDVRFSIVRIVISVSNVTSLQDCLWHSLCCCHCLGLHHLLSKLSNIVKHHQHFQKHWKNFSEMYSCSQKFSELSNLLNAKYIWWYLHKFGQTWLLSSEQTSACSSASSSHTPPYLHTPRTISFNHFLFLLSFNLLIFFSVFSSSSYSPDSTDSVSEWVSVSVINIHRWLGWEVSL